MLSVVEVAFPTESHCHRECPLMEWRGRNTKRDTGSKKGKIERSRKKCVKVSKNMGGNGDKVGNHEQDRAIAEG